MSSSLTCVDLFSGCGGLSLGLKRAGFETILAVEKSPMAAETYFHNFIAPIHDQRHWEEFLDRSPIEQAKHGLVVDSLEKVMRSREIMDDLKSADVDLVAGGPPCQGFSLAGRRDPGDARNQLPWQFLDFVGIIRPRAVIIENVSGMRSDFRARGARSPFQDLRLALQKSGGGYVVQPMLLNAAHFGVPQVRPRLFLVGIRNDLAKRASISATNDTWNSELDGSEVTLLYSRPHLAPKRTHFMDDVGPSYLTVRDAIADLEYSADGAGMPPSSFAREMRCDQRFIVHRHTNTAAKQTLSNHVVRLHTDVTRERFRLYQYFRDAGVNPTVLSIPRNADLSGYQRRKLMHAALQEVEYPALCDDGNLIAHSRATLMRLISRLATKKRSQRALSWETPSPTVLSLPDDMIHPSQPRIPTVRELARFQSFPDAFEFRSKETTGAHRRRFEVPQYTQVGNAVPPMLAECIGQCLARIMATASRTKSRKTEDTAVA